jgi:chromosome segregation ATPase
VGLNLIDSSYSYINSVIKKQSAQEKQLKKEIQEKKKQLQCFRKLDIIIEKSEKFEQLQEKLITLDKKHADLSSTIDKIEQTREVLVLQKKIESTSNPLRSLQKALDSLKEQKQKTERILKYTRLLMELQTKINKQTKPQKRIKQMTEELTQQIQVLEDKKRKTKAIQKIATALKESGDQFDTVSKSTAKAQKEFERYKAKLKICPLCDSKLN